ncbi:MAG: lipocalin-like domain-containing protein [Desulfobacterales bacterium]|nr:lipocalin-like domain-containing protein [Desulfobacterales bacterium]
MIPAITNTDALIQPGAGRKCRPVVLLLGMMLMGWLVSARPLPASDDAGYRRVTGPCRFEFPRDHGAHPGYRTEWWYYTGNLTASDGSRFGFQLTFFRRQLRPSDDRRHWPEKPSAWRTNQIFLAHAALTDIDGGRHYAAEDVSRGALDLAGVEQHGSEVRVFLGNWETVVGPEAHALAMTGEDFGFNLRLEPAKAPVAHGDQGYSRKGTDPARASCYYSFTRLNTRGVILFKGRQLTVEGLSWMDHEYSTAPLEPGIRGWSWFSLQFDNGAELMLFLLNLEAGGYHPASSGTLVAADGTATPVNAKQIQAEVLRTWKSPATGAEYPLGWRLRLDGIGLDLTIQTPVDDQEMKTSQTTGVTYWEGSVAAEGRYGGQEIKGRGYMELTGATQAMDERL